MYPTKDSGGFANPSRYTFSDYFRDKGFLTFTKTRHVLDPYIRLKIFSSAKFDNKKYEEDKEKIVDYYNSLGHRDAAIVRDTVYRVDKPERKY